MPVVQCRDCRGRVAPSAPTCPHCGSKRPGQPKGDRAMLDVLGWVGAVVVVVGLIVVGVVVLPLSSP
ncbi:MAG: hypothetical protein AAGA29_05000 [Planctomycetota bacterium]